MLTQRYRPELSEEWPYQNGPIRMQFQDQSSSDPKYAMYKFVCKTFVCGALRNENFTGSMWTC